MQKDRQQPYLSPADADRLDEEHDRRPHTPRPGWREEARERADATDGGFNKWWTGRHRKRR